MNKLLFATQNVTDTRDTDVEGVGTLRWDGDKCYRWVANATTDVSFTVGEVVCHDITNTSTMMQTIIKPATADLSMLAGVCVSNIASSTGTNPKRFGWIQVFGYCATVSVINLTDATPAAGDYMKAVNAQTYLTKDAATQASYRRTVQTLEAIATHTTPAATSKKGFVNCL